MQIGVGNGRGSMTRKKKLQLKTAHPMLLTAPQIPTNGNPLSDQRGHPRMVTPQTPQVWVGPMGSMGAILRQQGTLL